MRTSFLGRSNDRALAPGYAGAVLVWDIDKTYLDTRFSSLRSLLGIPFEFALDKRSIPGAVPLLRGLRRGPGPDNSMVPLYFISGSPPQLRSVIERKMTLDGVQYDGLTFKDQLGLLMAGRSGEIRAQVGYKLSALLHYRREIPTARKWLLFGDDFEEDASAFVVFGEVCAGLFGSELAKRLARLGVSAKSRAEIQTLASSLELSHDPVARIFIHLARGTNPRRFRDPRIVATRSYIQSAMVLAEMDQIERAVVSSVAKDLRRRLVPEEVIRGYVADARARLGVPDAILELAG